LLGQPVELGASQTGTIEHCRLGGSLRYPGIIRPLVAGLIAGLSAGTSYAVAQTEAGMPNAEMPPANAMPAPAMSPNDRRFDILEYVVDGNTVLAVPDVEEAVYPFLGEGRNAADVDKARETLEQVYRAKGFQTVQVAIPEQGIESGIIHLQVVENPIGRLRVVDSKYHSLEQIRRNAPSLAEGKVLNTNDVQKDIVALNQSPDLIVTPRLKSGEVPGTVDVDLQVQDRLPVHSSVEINNQYSQHTSELRVLASVGYDNLWQAGHSINLSYQIAPQNPSDAEVISGTYLFRIPDTTVNVLAYAVKSNSDVAVLSGTSVVGRGEIFGARAIIALPGSETFNHSLTAGLDRKNLTQNIMTAGQPSNAPVLYYPGSVAYAATWRNTQAQTVTQAGASINFALPAGSRSDEFDAQRFDAQRQYFYVKADFSYTRPLWSDFVLYEKFAAQFTGDSLLSSEQLSAGGANTVRGYLEAERLGDYGATATVEVRSPNFGQKVSSYVSDWRLHAFVDLAALAVHNPLPGERSAFRLAGAGLGTRFTAFDQLTGALDVAFALLDGAATSSGTTHFHFRLSKGF
jgi:hemolysin activation/secretion protein